MNPLPADWTLNVAIWAAIWAAIVGWQLVTLRSGRLPRFATVVRLARHRCLTRYGLVLFWGWLGVHLFVRTDY
ncbi:MAG: DUF6186 family protein [Actinomycetota bacterium]|jgi:TctA family transporter